MQYIEVLASPSPSLPATCGIDSIRYLTHWDSDLRYQVDVRHYLNGRMIYDSIVTCYYDDKELTVAKDHGAVIQGVLVNGHLLGSVG